MNKSARQALFTTAVLLVAGALLCVSLRGIEWKVVAETIASIRPGYAAIVLLLGIAPLSLRAVRWRILLEAEAPVSFKTTFWAVAAGYFGNNFLPARGGELVRSYIVREHSTLSVSYVLATALSERVADAVALVILGAVSLWFVPQAAIWTATFTMIGICGVLILAVLPKLERYAIAWLPKAPRLRSRLQQVLLGVRSFHDARRLATFTVLTLAIWLIDAVAVSTLAYGLSIPMPLPLSMLLIVALSLSSALPSAPGYVGIYQFVAVMVLKPFGISSSVAIAFILVCQAISYVLTGVLGLLAVTRYTRVRWRVWESGLMRPS